MGCRCSERRAALKAASRSLALGDLPQARAQTSFISRTAVEDMMKLINPRLTPEVKKPSTTTSTAGTKPRPK